MALYKCLTYLLTYLMSECHSVVCAVIFYCHSNASVQQSFLYAAQDVGMTNGQYAFFTLANSLPSQLVLSNSSDKASGNQINRSQAYFAVKQVTTRQTT